MTNMLHRCLLAVLFYGAWSASGRVSTTSLVICVLDSAALVLLQ